MPKHAGNTTYYRELQAEMDYYHLDMPAAERQLWYRMIWQQRGLGHSHHKIKAYLMWHWGFSAQTYYNRLKQARQTYAIP